MALKFGHVAFEHRAIGLADLETHTLRRRLPLPYPFSATWALKLLNEVTIDDYMCCYSYGKDTAFDGTLYHTAAIIPSLAHGGGPPGKWSMGANGIDATGGDFVEAGRWYYQGVRCYRTATDTVHEFYFDLPDTSKVSTNTVAGTTYFDSPGTSHMIRLGDVPWAELENLDGVMAGVKFWNADVHPLELAYEARSPWPMLPRYYQALWDCLPLTTLEDRHGARHSLRVLNGRRWDIIDATVPPSTYPQTPDRWRSALRPAFYWNLDSPAIVAAGGGGSPVTYRDHPLGFGIARGVGF